MFHDDLTSPGGRGGDATGLDDTDGASHGVRQLIGHVPECAKLETTERPLRGKERRVLAGKTRIAAAGSC